MPADVAFLSSAVNVNSESGRLTLRYLTDDGRRVSLDLTSVIEEIAERKAQEHMRAYHGHQL